MSNKIIVPFDDQEGGTYELNIDLDRLSKGGMLSAIRGMGHIVKKKQHSVLVEDDIGRLPEEIFGDVKGMNCRHLFSSMPSPQDVCDKTSNWEEGLNDLYNTRSLHCARSSNPFIPSLNKIEPSAIENAKLSWFKGAVKKAKSVGELKKTVERGLNAGIRTNACHEGQQSFADVVILKMLSIPCAKNEKKDMIHKLLLKGAFFSYDLLQNEQISEVYNKLYREVQPQIDKRLKKTGRNR